MAGFMAAHGYAPGPTQRPWTAGAISGALATLPAIALLHAFGSIAVEARILGISQGLTVVLGVAVMAAAGAVYARVFGRAANDLSGGWMFGMAYGFGLWTGGAVMVLPIVSGGLAPAGAPAVGVLTSLLAWGFTLGIAVPLVHRPLDTGIEDAARAPAVGPTAAATEKEGRRSGAKRGA